MKTSSELKIIDSELIILADEFSAECKTLSDGDYFSNEGKYHIQYADASMGTETNPASVSNRTGIIYISRKNIAESSNEYVYFMIIWAIVQNKLHDHLESDKIVGEHFLTTGRSRKNLLIDFNKMCLKHPTELNVERSKQLNELLNPE